MISWTFARRERAQNAVPLQLLVPPFVASPEYSVLIVSVSLGSQDFSVMIHIDSS